MEVNSIEFQMRHYVISLLHNCLKIFCNYKDNSEIRDNYEFQCILFIYFIIIKDIFEKKFHKKLAKYFPLYKVYQSRNFTTNC